MEVYDKSGNKVILTEEKDLDTIKRLINPDGYSDSGDANAYKDTGIYRIFDTDNNIPISNPNGILIVFKYHNSVSAQLFMNFSGETFVRVLWYGTWHNWIRLSNI